jgi:hypothetical protein
MMCAALTVYAASPHRLPDASTGALNGRVAVLLAPAEANGDLRDPAGCTVHLLSLLDREESVYSCGEWFQPERGGYIHWMQQGSSVSQQSVLRYGAEEFTGNGLIVVKALTAGGRVELDSGIKVSGAETFRIVSLSDERTSRPFTRRFDARHAKSSAVPTGPLLGGIFTADGDAVSLSLPVNVISGETHQLTPRLPKGGADVVVLLERSASRARCEPKVTLGKRSPAPDVSYQGTQRVIFVWYGIRGTGTATIAIDCAGSTKLEKRVRLEPGRVVTVRDELRKTTPKEKQ